MGSAPILENQRVSTSSFSRHWLKEVVARLSLAPFLLPSKYSMYSFAAKSTGGDWGGNNRKVFAVAKP